MPKNRGFLENFQEKSVRRRPAAEKSGLKCNKKGNDRGHTRPTDLEAPLGTSGLNATHPTQNNERGMINDVEHVITTNLDLLKSIIDSRSWGVVNSALTKPNNAANGVIVAEDKKPLVSITITFSSFKDSLIYVGNGGLMVYIRT